MKTKLIVLSLAVLALIGAAKFQTREIVWEKLCAGTVKVTYVVDQPNQLIVTCEKLP